jgi:uncharacterized protein YecA (UPF0149 family)
METLDYEGKQKIVTSFYEGGMEWLASAPIKWVVYGPYERTINPGFNPADNLALVYDTQDIKIYKVTDE